MNTVLNKVKCYARDERGAAAIEYGLITMLTGIALIVVLTDVGQRLNQVFLHIASVLNGA